MCSMQKCCCTVHIDVFDELSLTCSVAVKAPDLSTSFSFKQSASLLLTAGGSMLTGLSQLPIAARMLLFTSSFASSLCWKWDLCK